MCIRWRILGKVVGSMGNNGNKGNKGNKGNRRSKGEMEIIRIGCGKGKI